MIYTKNYINKEELLFLLLSDFRYRKYRIMLIKCYNSKYGANTK